MAESEVATLELRAAEAGRIENWLKLLHDGDFLGEKQFTSIHADCVELLRLSKSITKPTRRPPSD